MRRKKHFIFSLSNVPHLNQYCNLWLQKKLSLLSKYFASLWPLTINEWNHENMYTRFQMFSQQKTRSLNLLVLKTFNTNLLKLITTTHQICPLCTYKKMTHMKIYLLSLSLKFSDMTRNLYILNLESWQQKWHYVKKPLDWQQQ